MNYTPFVGRMQELDALSGLLRPDSTARLITLTGAPGVGKTRLAQEAAHAAASYYRDGVVCVDLGHVEQAEAVVPAIVTALHLSIPPEVSPETVLLTFATASHMLLVLDTCEHLIGEVVRVVELLLARTPLPVICCTCREPLGCAREVCVAVAPLPVPQWESAFVQAGADEGRGEEQRLGLERLKQVDSVRLFCGMAEHVRPGIVFEGNDWALIVAICRHVDGVPLALELAADQLRYFALEEVSARLGERLLVLSSGRRSSVRHRSLMATVEWSWRLLCEDERRLLWRLSIFASGFTLDAVEAFCTGKGIPVARVLDLLTRLLDKSLVIAERAEHGSRFRLLQIVRAYSSAQLEASGEGAEMAMGHATYFAAIAMRSHDGFQNSESERWTRRLDDEYANLCAAQAYLLKVSLPAAARMAADLSFYFVWRGRLDDAFALADALLRANADRQDPEVASCALRLRGMACLWTNDFAAGYKAILEAHRAAQSAKSATLMAKTRLLLAGAAVY